MHMKVKVAQSCPTLCDPIDCSPSGFFVPGILQARTLEWVAMPFSRDLPNPGIELRSPALQADSLLFELLGNPNTCICYVLICFSGVRSSPMDHSSQGSSVHGTSQARILGWVDMPPFRPSFRPRGSNPCLLHLLHCRGILYCWAAREAYMSVYTHIIFIFLSIMIYHRILNIISCAVQ